MAEQGTGRNDDHRFGGGGPGAGVVSAGQRAGPGEEGSLRHVAANLSFLPDQTGLWLATLLEDRR
jgi:hypothetical protein